MKRKSGLHKRVSSIFGEASLPENPPVKTPPADTPAVDTPAAETAPANNNNAAGAAGTANAVETQTATELPSSIVGGHTPRPPHPHAGPARKVSAVLTEDQEYDAAKKRKILLVIGLCVVLASVFFFNFYPTGKKIAASQDASSAQNMSARTSEIHWPEPKAWSRDIKDPMVFKPGAANLYARENEPFILKGIVQQPDGKSMALLGTDILYEGDEINGWTVKEVLKDVVRLEKADGEKLELKMKGK